MIAEEARPLSSAIWAPFALQRTPSAPGWPCVRRPGAGLSPRSRGCPSDPGYYHFTEGNGGAEGGGDRGRDSTRAPPRGSFIRPTACELLSTCCAKPFEGVEIQGCRHHHLCRFLSPLLLPCHPVFSFLQLAFGTSYPSLWVTHSLLLSDYQPWSSTQPGAGVPDFHFSKLPQPACASGPKTQHILTQGHGSLSATPT